MSKSSAPEPSAFVAHPLCLPHLRKVVEDAIDTFDSAWLLPPQPGEGFDTAKDRFRQLQGYALSRGFAVVTTTSNKTRAQFARILHEDMAKNLAQPRFILREMPKAIVSNRVQEQPVRATVS
jgi:hypothetical protein